VTISVLGRTLAVSRIVITVSDMSAPAAWLVQARTPVPRRPLQHRGGAHRDGAGVLVLAAVAVGGLTPPPTMAAAFLVACPLMGVVALVVLAGRGRDSRDPGLLWAAAGLLVAVAAMVLQAAAFVVFSEDGGPLRTTSDGRALLFVLLHLTVYLAAFAAWRRWGAAARAGFVVIGLLVLVAVAADRGLLDRGLLFDGATQPLFTLLQGITVVIGVLALVAWVSSQPQTSGLHGWVAVAMMLSVFELLLNMLAVGRYDPAWWASTVLRTALFSALAIGVVIEVLRSTRRLETYADAERPGASPSATVSGSPRPFDGARSLGRATTAQVADVVADLVCEVGGVGRRRGERRPEVGGCAWSPRGLDDVDDAGSPIATLLARPAATCSTPASRVRLDVLGLDRTVRRVGLPAAGRALGRVAFSR
jgi:hypothetical protein